MAKILVADDEKGIRMMLMDMLTIDGYDVYEAVNGEDAIEKFQEVQPDLVLMDWMMPGLSGFDACREIRALPTGKNTPVLMLTAMEDANSIEQALEVGAADYVTKPIRWPLLRHRVHRLLESSIKEEVTSRERNLLRILIDNLPDYVFVKDLEGRFVVTNIANTHYLGAKRPQEVIGKTDYDFFPPDRARAYQQRDMEIIEAGNAPQTWEQHEEDLRTGRKRWYSITKVPFLDGQDKALGIVGMIRDITRDKEARDDMRLANEQLIELNLLKSHFLLTMSHELRTPLISILGYSEMLLNALLGDINEKQRDRLERIHQNGQHLLTLIDDVLDISKIQTGQMELKLHPTRIESLIQECFNGYNSTAQKKGLAFAYDIEPNLPAVVGDSTAILKVLTNLTSNAIKFTARGGVRIVAEQATPQNLNGAPRDIDLNRDWVLVTVEDTGIGISPDDQKTLFNEFRQIDSAPTREQGGTGLGLALSHKLTSLMQGQMWLESEVGNGCKFYVLLPAVA